MTQFLAKVGTLAGDIEELAMTADTENVLRDELREKGYHVFWVRRSFGLRGMRNPFSRGQRITHTEFTLFNQELAALLKAGLPLLQCLDIMLERRSNLFFKRVLTDIRNKVKSGMALSDAFRSHGDLFPRIYAASLVAGEKSGGLETVLKAYVRYLKLSEATRKKVIAALVYPAFLFATLMLAAAFLLLWVIPRFRRVLRSLRRRSPVPDRRPPNRRKYFARSHRDPNIRSGHRRHLLLCVVEARRLQSHDRSLSAEAPVSRPHIPPLRDIAIDTRARDTTFWRHPSRPGHRHLRGLDKQSTCRQRGHARRRACA